MRHGLVIALGSLAFAGAAWAAESAKKEPAGKSDRAAVTKPQAAAATTGEKLEIIDWAKADLNGDNLISPEEMTKYSEANPGPLNPKRAQTNTAAKK